MVTLIILRPSIRNLHMPYTSSHFKAPPTKPREISQTPPNHRFCTPPPSDKCQCNNVTINQTEIKLKEMLKKEKKSKCTPLCTLTMPDNTNMHKSHKLPPLAQTYCLTIPLLMRIPGSPVEGLLSKVIWRAVEMIFAFIAAVLVLRDGSSPR